MEVAGLALTTTGPALSGLAALISALKEPFGRKKIELMRSEFAAALDEIGTVLRNQNTKIANLELLVAYLRLPFYKRWFRKVPEV